MAPDTIAYVNQNSLWLGKILLYIQCFLEDGLSELVDGFGKKVMKWPTTWSVFYRRLFLIAFPISLPALFIVYMVLFLSIFIGSVLLLVVGILHGVINWFEQLGYKTYKLVKRLWSDENAK